MNLKSILSWVIIFLLSITCSREREYNHDRFKETIKQNRDISVPTEVDTLENVSLYSVDSPVAFNISFKKVTSFGNSKDTLFRGIGHFTIDDAGKVYILNGHKVEVFNRQGEHIKTLAGSGQGPGEFDSMQPLKPKTFGHKLYVYGHTLFRVNSYNNKALKFDKTIQIYPKNWENEGELTNTFIQNFWPVNDSLFIFSFEDGPDENAKKKLYEKYFLINHEGKLVSKEIFKYPKKNDNTLAYAGKRFFMPFKNASGRYMCVQMGPDNSIYTSRTNHFLIKIYSPRGKYQHAIYYDYQNKPLDKQEIIDTHRYNKTALKQAKGHEYPDTWPAIDRFIVDDEKRIWVATIAEDKDNYTWWVLDDSGKLLTKFKWPGKRLNRADRFRVTPQVKNGYWYTRQNDFKTGFEQVTKYKIQFSKKK